MLASLIFLAGVSGAAGEIPEPTTVNGQVLGPAEDFSTKGPARICLGSLAIELVEGESAYLDYLGIHDGRMRILAGKEYFDISVGNAFVPQKSSIMLRSDGKMRIYAGGDEAHDWYLMYQRTEWSGGDWAYVGRISGTRMKSDGRDHEFLKRLSYADYTDTCRVRYNYGWDMILGEEPLIQREEQ